MKNPTAAVALAVCLVMVAGGCGSGEPQRLPDSAFKVSFEPPDVPHEMAAGEQVVVRVSFRNTSGSTWPSKPDSRDRNAVHFAYHWTNEQGDMVIYDGVRTPLPQDVNPGDSVALTPALQAPERVGNYILEMTLVQEGVAWFPDKGGDKISIPVRVVDALAASSNAQKVIAEVQESTGETLAAKPERTGATKGAKKFAALKNEEERAVAAAGSSKRDLSHDRQIWSVQVVSLSQKSESESIARKLRSKGYDAYVATARIKGKELYQVHVGRLATRGEAEKLRENLKTTEKFESTFIAHKG